MKKFLLLREDKIEYTIHVHEIDVNETKFILKYNGNTVLEAFDFGDGVNVGLQSPKGYLEIAYDVVEELGTLMRFISIYSKGTLNAGWLFKVISDENPIKI